MIAVSLDNLLFFLLIAVAALFQLLSKAISKAGKSDSNETSSSPRPQTPRPIQRAPRESDADRIRKFLEALGQPPSSTPPPPVVASHRYSASTGGACATASRNPRHVAITSGTTRETGHQSKRKSLHLNSRAVCRKPFHHPYRLRLRRRSKFMKHYPLSFSSRRLSSRRSKLTRPESSGLPNAQISR